MKKKSPKQMHWKSTKTLQEFINSTGIKEEARLLEIIKMGYENYLNFVFVENYLYNNGAHPTDTRKILDIVHRSC